MLLFCFCWNFVQGNFCTWCLPFGIRFSTNFMIYSQLLCAFYLGHSFTNRIIIFFIFFLLSPAEIYIAGLFLAWPPSIVHSHLQFAFSQFICRYFIVIMVQLCARMAIMFRFSLFLLCTQKTLKTRYMLYVILQRYRL